MFSVAHILSNAEQIKLNQTEFQKFPHNVKVHFPLFWSL